MPTSHVISQHTRDSVCHGDMSMCTHLFGAQVFLCICMSARVFQQVHVSGCAVCVSVSQEAVCVDVSVPGYLHNTTSEGERDQEQEGS